MARRAVLLAGVLVALATVVAVGAPYEFYRTAWCVALFQNGGTETFAGLEVRFSGPVVLVQSLGIGTTLALESNEAGILVFAGTIPPFTTWEIDWALDRPTIVEAGWIRPDGTRVAINTHAPRARLAMQFPPEALPNCPGGTLVPFFPIDMTFLALGSSDPDAPRATRWNAGSPSPGCTR
jgi:hypothetical protein